MDENYNCETCDFEDCHDCGRVFFNDGYRLASQEIIEYLKPNMDIGYADNLITITLDKRDWEVQLKKWGAI